MVSKWEARMETWVCLTPWAYALNQHIAAALTHTVVSGHKELRTFWFKLIKMELNVKMWFSVSLAPFQVLSGHRGLVATLLHSDCIERFQHHRKFYWTALCWRNGSFLASMSHHKWSDEIHFLFLFPASFLVSQLPLSSYMTQPSHAEMEEILKNKIPVKVEKMAGCDISAATVLNFGSREPLWGAQLAWVWGWGCSQLVPQSDHKTATNPWTLNGHPLTF